MQWACLLSVCLAWLALGVEGPMPDVWSVVLWLTHSLVDLLLSCVVWWVVGVGDCTALRGGADADLRLRQAGTH